MKNTLIVNLYGGPGTGKSTGAAYIFSMLKMAGVDCEYVQEYAKDRTWQHDMFPLKKCQLYVTGKQALRIVRLDGQVEVIITDSPILLGALYTDEQPYKDICIYEHCKYKNQINVFLKRLKKYNPNGRNQTENEAKEIDDKIYALLKNTFETFIEVDGIKEGYDKVIEIVKAKLEEQK